MRTAVSSTSIAAFHDHSRSGHSSMQRSRIVSFIEAHGGDWSIGELAQALQMEKSTVSARLNELLFETREVIEKPKRKDRVSGVLIRPVGLRPLQSELFQ